MDRITQKALAKINLVLDITGTREDGYHNIRTVMQTIGIADMLYFERTVAGIEITCDQPELSCGEDNLIYKAARLMIETYNIKGGIKVELEKNIPMAAGMAGGSADAAATLRGIRDLCEIDAADEELEKLGVLLGADVPYCIKGGTCLCEGIGEVLTQLPSLPKKYVLIAKPDIDVSTAMVYRCFDMLTIEIHPEVDAVCDAIKSGNFEGVAQNVGNILETVTIGKYPIIDGIKSFMKSSGALCALMSGSGPTVFGIYDDEDKAKEAFDVLCEENVAKSIFLTGFIN